LIKARQRTRARFLHQVVALIVISRQSVGEPAKARQEVHDLEAKVVFHGAIPPDRMDNGS